MSVSTHITDIIMYKGWSINHEVRKGVVRKISQVGGGTVMKYNVYLFKKEKRYTIFFYVTS